MSTSLCIFFVFLIKSISGHAIGAPCAAQHTLHPSSTYHGQSKDLKISQPPYRFSIADQDDLEVRTYRPGQKYTIRVYCKDSAHFRGFLIQPRVATKDGSLIGFVRAGHFVYDTEKFDQHGIQFQNCAPYQNDSITHRNSSLKYFLEVQWMAEKNYGPVQFLLTMVQEKDDFWEMWRPESGFLLPETMAPSTAAFTTMIPKTSMKPTTLLNEQIDLFQIQALSQRLEMHQAKKTPQIDVILRDQTDTEDDSESPSTAPPSSKSKAKVKGRVPLSTVPPPNVESEEEEEEEPKNQTASNERSSTITNVRLPTPKPPVENSTTELETSEEEEDITTPRPPNSKTHVQPANNVSVVRPEIDPTIAEENTNETESGAELQPLVPMAFTKPPFRIPVESLHRLRDLFKQAQLKKRNKTITAQDIAKLMPTPPPFPLNNNAPTQASLEESEMETTKPVSRNPGNKHQKATLAPANRLEFPTLAPFPSQSESKNSVAPNPKELSPTTALVEVDEETETEEADTTPVISKKATKGPQPALRLLKGATVAPEVESGDEEKESSEKTATTGAVEKTNSKNSSTEKMKSKISKIRTTTESAAEEEESAESVQPDEVTTEAVTVTRRSKAGARTRSPSQPLPGALYFHDDGVQDAKGIPNMHKGPTTPVFKKHVNTTVAHKNKAKGKPHKTGSPIPVTKTSTLEPAALVLNDEENEEMLTTIRMPKTKLNITIPEKRKVIIENQTIEEENDEGFLKEQDYCGSSPCLNKAQCINLAGEGRFKCKCNQGWTGTVCEKRDYCGEKHDCQNGGLCVNTDFGYTCNCTDLWVGKRCEKKCAPTLCKNGGTCAADDSRGFICICRPGYTGSQCEVDIDDCAGNPCKNGATCRDKVNGFVCSCQDGYMGRTCHRPCQNIYKSCEIWGEEGRCDTTRHTTQWFDINCAVTCGQCVFVNSTVKTLTPLPPVLEPFKFLMGKWSINTTNLHRFPIDFAYGNSGYYEEIEFAPVSVPMFGTPSINYTSISRNNQFPNDVIITHGFLTLKPSISPTLVALMSTSNDGITMIEEGTVPNNDQALDMKANYIAVVPPVDHKVPALAKRQFTIYSGYLRETVERSMDNQTTDYFTKYFYKDKDFDLY